MVRGKTVTKFHHVTSYIGEIGIFSVLEKCKYLKLCKCWVCRKKKREPAPYRYREVTYKIKISLNTRHIGRKGRARPVRLASAVGLDPVFMFGLETLTTLLLDCFPFFFLFFFFPVVKLEPSCLFPFLLFLHITAIRFPF